MRTLIALLLPAFAACAADAPPLKIHMIAAGEYDPEKSLAGFKKHLEAGWRVEVSTSFGSSKVLENLDALTTADVLVLFARRTAPPEAQMKVIRAHWEAGKPIVGIRTASHAFQKADNEVLDRKVFGGNYGGASSNGGFVTGVATGAADHPVLKGVGSIKASRYAYGQGEMAAGVQVLHVVARIKDRPFPVTWTNTFNGGRMLYTSMGAPDDFADAEFIKFLTNAVFWTAKRDADALKK